MDELAGVRDSLVADLDLGAYSSLHEFTLVVTGETCTDTTY